MANDLLVYLTVYSVNLHFYLVILDNQLRVQTKCINTPLTSQIIEMEDDTADEAMRKMMGFSTFGSNKRQKLNSNNESSKRSKS